MSAAPATVHVAEAIAMRSNASGTPVASSRTDDTSDTFDATAGRRITAANGANTINTGTATKTNGAGEVLGPSHQTGRPMVRLDTATASMHANVPTHVTRRTVRQPLEFMLRP